MSPFRGHKNRLDVETVLGGFVLANATAFINDGVPRHELFSHEIFRRSDERTFTHVLQADGAEFLGNRRIRKYSQFRVPGNPCSEQLRCGHGSALAQIHLPAPAPRVTEVSAHNGYGIAIAA